MIVVFDTSVWISAMHFVRRPSSPILALERARNHHVIAICDGIEEEIFRILTQRFGWEPAAVQYRLDFFLAKSIRCVLPGELHICRDPNDDMVLECAVASGAEFLVAGDKDLLVLGAYQDVRIVTSAEFLALSA